MPDLVIKDFRSCTRQSAEPVVAQHRQIICEGHARQFNAVNNLHGREGMDVHPRNRILYGAENIAVIELGKIARQTTLYADLGCAQLPGLDRFSRHIVEAMKISVCLARAAAECAEFASHETDIGEIDIAVDDVRY